MTGRRQAIRSDGGDSKLALYGHYGNYFADVRRRREKLITNLDQVNPAGAAAHKKRGRWSKKSGSGPKSPAG